MMEIYIVYYTGVSISQNEFHLLVGLNMKLAENAFWRYVRV